MARRQGLYWLIAKQVEIVTDRSFRESRREFMAKPIEELLDLLASSDLRTRFFAEMSLRDLTGT